jgi:hypothetical protein
VTWLEIAVAALPGFAALVVVLAAAGALLEVLLLGAELLLAGLLPPLLAGPLPPFESAGLRSEEAGDFTSGLVMASASDGFGVSNLAGLFSTACDSSAAASGLFSGLMLGDAALLSAALLLDGASPPFFEAGGVLRADDFTAGGVLTVAGVAVGFELGIEVGSVLRSLGSSAVLSRGGSDGAEREPVASSALRSNSAVCAITLLSGSVRETELMPLVVALSVSSAGGGADTLTPDSRAPSSKLASAPSRLATS